MQLPIPSPTVFSSLLSGDIQQLCSCSQDELRPFLPCLARMVLCSRPSPVPVVNEVAAPRSRSDWERRRKVVHALIAGMGEVNAISKYLTVDFHELKGDATKEQQLLKKLNPGEERGSSQSVLASSPQFGLAIEFERCDHVRRFRLFLREILGVLRQLDPLALAPFKFVQSDLFECEVHLEEICDIMCIAVAELPSLLPVVQLSEALLRLEKGAYLLTRLIANMPDTFDQVVTSLVFNGETLDEVSLAGRCRTAAIKSLCSMHPSRAAMVQSLAVTHCKHPTLALSIALEAEEKKMNAVSYGEGLAASDRDEDNQAGVVTLLHNIIIAGDEQTRAWFAQYLKCMQQKYRRHKSSAVTKLRWFIIKKLHSFSRTKKKVLTEHVWGSQEPLSATAIPEEAMETKPRTDKTQAAESPKESKQPSEEKATVEESVSSMEVAVGVSESADTLEELVDQMEIEISDHGEDGESEEATGDESQDESSRDGGQQEVEEKTGVGDKSGAEKIQSTATVSGDGGGVVGKSRSTEMMQYSRRRRHSSTRLDKAEFPPISIQNQLSDDEIIELMELLQVCCALKTQTQMYLKDDEAATILSLIACTCPPFSRAGIKFIEVTLCVLLACPFLISMEVCETAVVYWLKWLLEKLPEFNRACDGHCPYGELLLLIAIHLKEKQLDQIEELIADTLNMKVSSSLRSGHFSSLSKLFLQVFTEDVICAHAMSVAPTEGLSAEMSGYLPVHCVHQLIKMRTFRKHGFSIKDWIYRQLLTLSEPLHPTLPPLLQEFVNSILLSAITPCPRGAGGYNTAANKSHAPFTDEEVLEVFKTDPETQQSKYPIPSQILMIYYVLLYHDYYLSNLRALMMHHGQSTPRPYGHSVLTQIPLKRLSDHARRHPNNYSNLYPTMLKLMATQFPQLCLVCEWLTEKKAITVTKYEPIAKISSKNVTPETTLQVLQNLHSSPSKALLFLTYLSDLPPSAIAAYRHAITSTFHLLLDPPSVSRRVQALYVTIWTKINSVTPRKLWLETINALRPSEVRQMRPFTHQNLAEDPLTVLRCDRKVFRCPPAFDILLRILSAYTAASKSWLHEHAYTQNCISMATPESLTSSASHVTKQERDELCIALTAAQESAIIQLLLEICLPTEQDKKEEALFGQQITVLQEIRCLVCSYFHHTFICDPPLVKLVHFQGYPTELLPMMVSGVPSMHICLDFIPELLAQPQTEKQQFGIQLAAHVIEQYPLPDAMGIAKDIFKRLMVLNNEIPASMREEYFLPLLPSVVKLSKTFPPLCKEAAEFLVYLCKTCGASLSSKGVGISSLGVTTDSSNVFGAVFVDGEKGRINKAIQKAFEEIIKNAVVHI